MPVAQQAQQTYQVGQVVNGYQWNGREWVPAATESSTPQVVNGHQWDGRQWVPVAQQAPHVGQVVNGYEWNGREWTPLGSSESDADAAPAPQRAESAVIGQLKQVAASWSLTCSQEGSVLITEKLLGERTAFGERATLTYRSRIAVDDDGWQIVFSEMLIEAPSVEVDGVDSSVSATTFAEQLATYVQLYPIDFDHDGWRAQVAAVAEAASYGFKAS